MTIATAASLSTFTLEHIIRRFIKRTHQQTLDTINKENMCNAKDEEAATVSAADETERAETLENVVVAYTFETGIFQISPTCKSAN